MAAAAATLLVLACGALSWRYSDSFHDPIEFTSQAVESSPHLALAHLNRGIVLQIDGRVEEAEREYGTALSLDPTLAVTHNNLGLIYLNRDEIGRAEAAFQREIELNPTYDRAFFNLGLAHERSGRLEQAASSFRQAVALNVRNDEARSRLQIVEAHLKNGSVPGPSIGRAASPVVMENIPTDLLVRLYEDALRKEPHNREIRRAYIDICVARGLHCAKEQQQIMDRLTAARPNGATLQ